eukprot:TRINITY_DN24127_c0_g1_i1.p1 TRINITY_DN24127_c0_g1~~TRINITY_DN24127_c0_g1_i1.p1  ORF type:complete len:159 (+),score=37.69 TRINITY_DN24127_c0_g1_i1:37-513(+)
MVKYSLSWKADLESLTNLSFEEGYRINLNAKCINCDKEQRNLWIDPAERYQSGTKGTVHSVFHCKECKRELTIELIDDKWDSTITDEETGEWKVVATFDCRGVELTEWILSEGFTADGVDTKSEFLINLESGEFYDVDAESSQPVSVTNIEHKFCKVK